MDYNNLISMPVGKAESILKKEGIKYAIKKVKTFKLDSFDTEAVINVKSDADTLILYVCNFLCGTGTINDKK